MPSSRASFSSVQVVDSHTAGEPTSVVVDGGPALGDDALAERLRRFAAEFDDFRSAVVNEPRGSDVLVGALLCKPVDRSCATGVIFFNNVGYLGMCGHGTIGVVATLAHLGRIGQGEHRIETPVGVVRVTLRSEGNVTVENVASYRHMTRVSVTVEGFGTVIGEIAWGGNWFFLLDDPPLRISRDNVEQLTEFAWAVRNALRSCGFTGANRAEIDHIELSCRSPTAGVDSRNFVLCPGKAYDRSPCGTGTSAKLACLAAEGKLAPGQVWRQAGILDTVFEGSYELREGKLIPSITGSAFVTAESRLILNPDDPFSAGIPL
ncbi:MAG TPA: proline racemase family protein [Terracidiphilus sp.]|nr:proline racemase family protein [Terracidiphilus sp.]